jgi:hypothetical protein
MKSVGFQNVNRQSNSKYSQPYHSKHAVQVSVFGVTLFLRLSCYDCLLRNCTTPVQIFYTDNTAVWTRYQLRSEIQVLHFVNLSEQTATSVISEERNSATTTEVMRVRYCLYTALKCWLPVLIALQITNYVTRSYIFYMWWQFRYVLQYRMIMNW